MSQNDDRSIKGVKYVGIGIAFGVILSILFAVMVNPGLIGVGISIGLCLGIALQQHAEQG